jgi:hypothetical protein
LLEPFTLNEAEGGNINSWISVVGSWINLANNSLIKLRLAALDELLLTEAHVANMICSGNSDTGKAPEPIEIKDNYPRSNPDIPGKTKI